MTPPDETPEPLRRLRAPRGEVPAPAGPSCLPDETLRLLAAGMVAPEEARGMVEHVALCDRCGPIMAAAAEDFDGELSAEEAALMVSLPSSTRAGHRGLERQFVQATARPRGATAWRPVLLWVAAAGLLVCVASSWWWMRTQRGLAGVNRLLAQTYTSNRTLELRLPGARHGPMRLERGAAGGDLARQPPELLEAAAAIQRALERAPGDAQWLHARGRLEILEWRPQQAIQSLEAARDGGATASDVLIDLATAYYQQAKREGSPAGVHKAVELLGRVLRADANNPSALFNRALLEEELQETAAAVADLDKMLQLEPGGGWSEEAHAVLARLRSRRRAFLERDPREDRERFDEIRLDALLAGEAAEARPDAEFAALTRRLLGEHQDTWLAELAALPPAAIDPEELRSLGRMTSIRLTVEKGRYQEEKSVFDAPRRAQPAPVASWHGFEALFRATHARGEFRCPETSDALLSLAERHSYRWLAVQVLREQGYCSFQRGEIDLAERYAQRSIELARQSGYPVAAVRSEALLGHVAIRRGQFRHALEIAHRALAQIVAERLPVARSQEFYNLAMVAGEGLEWWHAARAAAASVTETAQVAGFRDLEFTGTVRWAQLTLRSGDRKEAGRLFEQALGNYQSLAPSPDRGWAEIGFADASGDGSRLDQFAQTLDKAPDAMLWIPYERVRARLALEGGRLAEARVRVERIVKWMAAHDAGQPPSGYRWQAEFRAAGQVMLELLEREGRLPESFGFLQQWLAMDERAHTPVSAAARVAVGPAVAFAFAGVGAKIAVWRRDGTEVSFRWCAVPRAEAERMARCFGRLMESPESSLDEIRRLGAQIRTGLFGSWLDGIPRGRPVLIQVYEGPLANLAFAALPGLSEELGLEHPVAVTPFELQPEGAAPETGAVGRFLLVDASEARAGWATDLPPLASARREVAAIYSVWPDAEILREDAARPESVLAHLPGVRLLHFAGHALFAGSEVALVLPGSKKPGDLLQWGGGQMRSPRTVVLSACSTGRGTATVPDAGSPESLATAFLLKGSGEVIASLWDVDSLATEELMRGFYEQLRKGGDTGRALQAAMAGLRRTGRFSHPHYWAAFARFVRT